MKLHEVLNQSERPSRGLTSKQPGSYKLQYLNPDFCQESSQKTRHTEVT
jgi:hypothetical protein